MPEYRIRYVVGRDILLRPTYHSVTVENDQPPTAEQALDAAFLQESHLYETEVLQERGEEEYTGAEIEIDDIRELAPMPPIVGRQRARFIYNYETEEWDGPIFEGPARHY